MSKSPLREFETGAHRTRSQEEGTEAVLERSGPRGEEEVRGDGIRGH